MEKRSRLRENRILLRVPASLLLLALAAAPSMAGQGTAFNSALPLIHVDNGPNSANAQNSHYVVLVSLDGFRWDYARRDNATHLLALGRQGVWAPEGMLPSYPSLTFPNLFTIVTGLYPGHHGLVADSFFDPARHARFSSTDPQSVSDGSWYSGTPLWSLAESQGMRTACLGWPGSEAKIAGFQPSWYAQSIQSEAAPVVLQAPIDEALALLRLPSADRPHFIAIDDPEPDRSGRQFGPNAQQTRAAALRMDAVIGKLKAALDATGLPIDLVVVSGQGMAQLQKDQAQGCWIDLDQFADLTGFDTVGSLLYGKSEADRERVYNQLKKASSQFVVYRLKNVPANLDYNRNPREGDPVVIATGPYAIRAHATPARNSQPPTRGVDGYDSRSIPEMKAIFFAAGPDIVAGKTLAQFENVNLYPWIAHILGLTPPPNDGSLNILAGTLRDNGVEPADTPPAQQ
jgi:alkaline phosphatase D